MTMSELRRRVKDWWRRRHNQSSGVAQTRYTDTQEYEDYSTDVRPLVLAKRK